MLFFFVMQLLCLSTGAFVVYWAGYLPLWHDRERIYRAIRESGYGLMKCSNGWSIQDVSDKAKLDAEKELEQKEEA